MFLKAKQQQEMFIGLVSNLKSIKSGNVDALLVLDVTTRVQLLLLDAKLQH